MPLTLALPRSNTGRAGAVAAGALVFGVLGLALFAREGPSPFTGLFKRYQPREFCMLYEPGVIWLHVVADAGIALAYYSIPLALLYFVRKRSDLTFRWIFVWFAVFILACGTTHVMNIVAMWYAAYRFDGVLKLFTAVVSIITAGILWPLIPRALAIPSPAALRDANAGLAREIQVRRAAEESLRAMQAGLEQRVAARTSELQEAYQQLSAEMAARTAAEQERENLLARERAARAEAERANRIKDDFLATLSHELRTPIGAITNWVYLLRTGSGGPEELEEGLKVIDRSAHDQAALIDDLLDMSRIISGNLRLKMQPVELKPVLAAALQTVKPFAATKDVQVSLKLEATAVTVKGDAARLQQVVWNLLINAIKFTPKSGHVELLLAAKAGWAELTVRDDGAGIDPGFLPRLFERFRQADSSMTRRHGGLGLGLAIVRELVESHGGTVRAASAGLGRGATFVVSLPTIETAAVPVPRPASAPRLDGMTVLLVEDEPESRTSLSRVLERFGAKVAVAENARLGFAIVREQRPALVLSDIGMPEEDGISFIRRIRLLSAAEGGQTPALALTAFAGADERRRALEAGFDAYLTKPIGAEALVTAIHRAGNGTKNSPVA